MARVEISGLADGERTAIEQAADEANMNLAEFCRHRLRAGYRLWDDNEEFDVEKFQERAAEKEPTDTNAIHTKSANASKEDRFADQIKRNLPTEDDDAVSKDELVEIVSQDVITDVLSDLKNSGEVEYIVEHDGFVRTE